MALKLLKLQNTLDLTAESRSTHYARIQNGTMVHGVRLGENSVAWPEYEITAIIAARIAGQNDDQIRELVKRLESERKNLVPGAVYANA